MSATLYNRKSPAVKRILQEALELQKDPSVEYFARPLEDNIFEWHFTVRGPSETEFDGGRYHGRILLPNEYPFKPPELMLLTPNGRFELNKKICLSITGYHPEFWQPAWGIRTVMLGIMGFFPTKANGAIGGIDYTENERKILASRSRGWTCPICGTPNIELLPEELEGSSLVKRDGSDGLQTRQEKLPQFAFVYKEDKKKAATATSAASSSAAQGQIESTSPSELGEKHDQAVELIQGERQTDSASSEYKSDEIQIDATGSENAPQKVFPPVTQDLAIPAPHAASAQPPAISRRRNHEHAANSVGNHSTQPTAVRDGQQARTHVTAMIRQRPPQWLDGLIVGLLILIAGLVMRRVGWVVI